MAEATEQAQITTSIIFQGQVYHFIIARQPESIVNECLKVNSWAACDIGKADIIITQNCNIPIHVLIKYVLWLLANVDTNHLHESHVRDAIQAINTKIKKEESKDD